MCGKCYIESAEVEKPCVILVVMCIRKSKDGSAHSRHIMLCHIAGDLKPENVFFDSQAVLKLGDFGLAKFSIGPNDHLASAYQSDAGESLNLATEKSQEEAQPTFRALQWILERSLLAVSGCLT